MQQTSIQLLTYASQNEAFAKEEEAVELISNGLVSLDTSQVDPADPTRYKVIVSEDGAKYLSNITPTTDNSTAFEIDTNIPVPKITRSGAGPKAKYPFHVLDAGASFHVPMVPSEDIKKLVTRIRAAVSNANKQNQTPVFENGQAVMVTKTQRKYETQEDGTKKLIEEKEVQVQEMQPTKKFVVREVDENDPRGKGVRVFRTL